MSADCSMFGSVKCPWGTNPSPGTCMTCDLWDGSPRGAGDVIHRLASPIAKILDRRLGTAISKCGGCRERRRKLNRALPFNRET